MRYLLAVILPPVAVWITKRHMQALVNILLRCLGWIPGVVHALYLTKRGPLLKSPGDITRFIIDNFYRVETSDFSNFEKAVSRMNPNTPERGLIYALRVSAVLPTLKSLKTLESRWQTANSGAAGRGLTSSERARNYKRVYAFLQSEYLSHADRILAEEEGKFREKIENAATDRSRLSAMESWIRKLDESKGLFVYELPGFDALVDTYIQRAEQAGDGKPDPVSS